jgi:hypothetical protein
MVIPYVMDLIRSCIGFPRIDNTLYMNMETLGQPVLMCKLIYMIYMYTVFFFPPKNIFSNTLMLYFSLMDLKHTVR